MSAPTTSTAAAQPHAASANASPLEAPLPAGSIREHGWQEAHARFGRQWHELVASGDFNVSLAPGFARAVAASHGVEDKVRVLVAEHDGKVVGVLPFFTKRARMLSVPVTMLSPVGNLVSYHQEVVAPGRELELLRACLGGRRWDVFCASGVPAESPTAQAIRAVAAEVGSALVYYPSDSSPYLPIAGTWEQFLAAKSSNFRYNMRRKEKALRKDAAVEERWFRSAEDVPELLRCMKHIEAKSWKIEANIAVVSRPHEVRYYELLLPALADQGVLLANALYLDGEPIAYHLCYSFHGRIGNLKTSFDEAHQARSPGAVIIANGVRRAFELGAREFDFLGDAQHHKMLWTDQVRPHGNFYVFSRGLRGRALGIAKRLAQKLRRSEFHRIVRRRMHTEATQKPPEKPPPESSPE